MKYTDAAIYYLTGTGNSYRVATWLAETGRSAGAAMTLCSVDRGHQVIDLPRGPKSLLAIVTPTHGFTAPWYIIRFALNLPAGAGTHVVIIPTRGGTKVGSLFLPGFQGTCGYLLALILTLKGYKLRGVIGIDMPSNWTSLHWGINKTNSAAIIARGKNKAIRFIEQIFTGRTYFGGLIELFLGLLILPVSFGYLLYGRFFLAKLLFATNHCTGCRLCVENCPVGAIKMYGGKPYWTFNCESCMRCMNFCPVRAIEASHPLVVAMIYITSFPAAAYLLNHLVFSFPALQIVTNPVVKFIVEYSYFLLSITITYLLFMLANRIPIISRVFSLTTLTHYFRRYHEPDTKLRDINRNLPKRNQSN